MRVWFSRELLRVGCRYGEPARPDCYPHGFMNPNYTCSCWDETIYKGPTCKESCVQVSRWL